MTGKGEWIPEDFPRKLRDAVVAKEEIGQKRPQDEFGAKAKTSKTKQQQKFQKRYWCWSQLQKKVK